MLFLDEQVNLHLSIFLHKLRVKSYYLSPIFHLQVSLYFVLTNRDCSNSVLSDLKSGRASHDF